MGFLEGLRGDGPDRAAVAKLGGFGIIVAFVESCVAAIPGTILFVTFSGSSGRAPMRSTSRVAFWMIGPIRESTILRAHNRAGSFKPASQS